MTTIWVAQFRWDSPSLAMVEVSKETDKTFSIVRATNVLNYIMLNKRISKEREHWFRTEDAAIEWLIEKQKNIIVVYTRKIEIAKRQLEELASRLESVGGEHV